jgi:Flp pilus assembly protein TadD
LLVYAVLLSVLTVAAYQRVRLNEFIGYDDDTYLLDDHAIAEGLPAVARDLWTNHGGPYWQPIVALSFGLDRSVFGSFRADLFHAENVAWHLACVLLVFSVLVAATGRVGRSAAVAALFAVHPVNVEAVAWAVERRTVLATAFALAAMLAYVSWTRRATAWKAATVLLFTLLGTLSKPMVVILPALLLLLDLWPLRRLEGALLRRCVEKIPVGLVCLTTAAIVLMRPKPDDPEGRPLALRVGNALVSVWRHLGHLGWPAGLGLFYPFPDVLAPWLPPLAAAGILGVSLAAVALVRRAPFVCFGWFWFLSCLLPTLGLTQIGTWPALADRFAYLAEIGLFVAVVWSVAEFVRRPVVHRVAAAGVTAALGCATVYYVEFWRDSVRLFGRAVEVAPESGHMHFSLGTALLAVHRPSEAIVELETAVRLHPTIKVYTNLASTLIELGRDDEAVQASLAALRIDPNHVEARYNLGLAQLSLRQPAAATEAFRETLRIDPEHGKARANLGAALNQLGRFGETITLLGGNSGIGSEGQFNLAVAYAATGDSTKARDLAGRLPVALRQQLLAYIDGASR